MAEPIKKDIGCVEGGLTFGGIRLVSGGDRIFPEATHRFYVDLLPTARGQIVLLVPTIELGLLSCDDGVDRSFVLKRASGSEDRHLSFVHDGGWHSFGTWSRFASPVTRVRLSCNSARLRWSAGERPLAGQTSCCGDSLLSGDALPIGMKAYASEDGGSKNRFSCEWVILLSADDVVPDLIEGAV